MPFFVIGALAEHGIEAQAEKSGDGSEDDDLVDHDEYPFSMGSVPAGTLRSSPCGALYGAGFQMNNAHSGENVLRCGKARTVLGGAPNPAAHAGTTCQTLTKALYPWPTKATF